MPTHVHTCASDRELEDELATAFRDAQAAGADALVIAFPTNAKLSRELVPVIVALARGSATLTAIALVHESPRLSFVASSLALQLPGVRVRSAGSVDTAGL